MDLRPTALAGTLGSPPDSFQGNRLSIGPFSYKIFRPSPLFSDEAVDLVLSMSERLHQHTLDCINEGVVDTLLEQNFGPDARGSGRLVAGSLDASQLTFFQSVYQEIIKNPAEFAALDLDALRDTLGLPKASSDTTGQGVPE